MAAIEQFGKAIRAHPDEPVPYYNRAVAYTAAGELAAVYADLDTFIERTENTEMLAAAETLRAQLNTGVNPSLQ